MKLLISMIFFTFMSSPLFAQNQISQCQVHDDTFNYSASGHSDLESLKSAALRACEQQNANPRNCVEASDLDCLQLSSQEPSKEISAPRHDVASFPMAFMSTMKANGPPDGRTGGSCTVFKGCEFPNSCVNGFCKAPGGGGGDCTVFSGCKFPNSCVNGFCQAPGGGGGQCTVFEGCEFPARCENGWCVR